MHPVLLELPGWGPINAYGTLILLGGLLAMPGVYWELRARGLGKGQPGSMLVDLYLVLVFGAAIGGRVLHVLTAPGPYLEDPARLLSLADTGFVFFGSMLFIAGGFVWLARRYEAPLHQVWDAAATWMPLGHALGRVGCLLAGCCWGAPSGVPWALEFPETSVAYGAGEVGGHKAPTPALPPPPPPQALGLLALFGVMLGLRRRHGIEAPWRQVSRYAIGYGLLRFAVEALRGDPSRGLLLEARAPLLSGWLGLPPDQPLLLSVSQAIALVMVALGLFGLRRRAGTTG